MVIEGEEVWLFPAWLQGTTNKAASLAQGEGAGSVQSSQKRSRLTDKTGQMRMVAPEVQEVKLVANKILLRNKWKEMKID